MGKITFTNKNKAGTGDVTLWKDTDANEVKTSVNAIYDTTLTIAGTTNQITATGGAQNLEGNRLWTISLPTTISTGIISATTCFVGSGAGLTGTASSLTAIPASHTHGDISNSGTITSTAITPANGDYILLSDITASGSIKRGIVLGTSTTTFLANNGTWLTPAGGTGGASELNGLTDVTLTTPSTGQLLCRHSDGQWINWTPTYGGGVSESMFNSHTGDSTIHYTQASISITTSQVSNLSSYTGFDSKYPSITNFNSHTGNTACHFTQAQISITESQISDLGSYATTTNFNSHTGNTACHFTQASISITESQISDLGSYATTTNLSNHTGDSTIHYTQANISITESQISDLKNYTVGVNTSKITVDSTAPTSPATGDLWVDTSA